MAGLAGVLGVAIGLVFTGGTVHGGPLLAALATAFLLSLYEPVFAVAAIVLAIPFILSRPPGASDLALVTGALAMPLVVIVVRQVRDRTTGWQRSRADLPVLIFAMGSALSLAGTVASIGGELAGLFAASTGVLVFCLTTQALRTRAQLIVVVGGLVATGLLQAAGAAIGVADHTQRVSEATRATGWLTDPNHFAGYLVIVIPVLVAVGLSQSSRWSIVPTALATIVLVLALLATLSRSGWLGLLAAAVVLAASLPMRRSRLLFLTVAVAGVFLLAGLSVPIAARLAPHSTGPWEMLDSRVRVWTVAVTLFGQHPIFGIGIGNFGPSYASLSSYPVGVRHAHNLFLNIAVERGVLAVSGFVGVCVTLLLTLLASWRRAVSLTDRALPAGLAAGLVGYLVHSLFDVSYYDYSGLLLFWLFAGIVASLPRVLGTQSA